MKRCDHIVIGAGIVGLATAYKLILENPTLKVLVLEKEATYATHQSGRNSGVIHSGLYYRPGSFKAKLCVQGHHELLKFAEEKSIPYKLCGKLVVANGAEEEERLSALRARGEANGLRGIKILTSEEASHYEPHVQASKALWVPQTGVIDFRVVCQNLVEQIQGFGSEVLFSNRVVGLNSGKGSWVEVYTEKENYFAESVINCAGLFSDKISEMDSPGEPEHKIIPFRGEYYDLTPEAAAKVRGLIYPVPNPEFPFLGVHLTRGVNGHVEAGPNAVLALSREGYRWTDVKLDEFSDILFWPGFQGLAKRYWDVGIQEFWRSLSKSAFLANLQRLMPSLRDEDLVKGGSGVRAQAVSKCSELLDDFSFRRSGRVLHVLNAPSPAATSSFAVASQILKEIHS